MLARCWVAGGFGGGRWRGSDWRRLVWLGGNVGGPALPTAQLGLFPVNINVDLNDDGLQLNFTGGAVWNLTFQDNGIVSTWGTQLGVGLVGKFRLF